MHWLIAASQFMKEVDLFIQTSIYEVISTLPDTSIYHVIYAKYYFLGVQMSTYEPVYISRQTVREIFLAENGIQCQMMLDAHENGSSSSIFIPFDGVERIFRVNQAVDRH